MKLWPALLSVWDRHPSGALRLLPAGYGSHWGELASAWRESNPRCQLGRLVLNAIKPQAPGVTDGVRTRSLQGHILMLCHIELQLPKRRRESNPVRPALQAATLPFCHIAMEPGG